MLNGLVLTPPISGSIRTPSQISKTAKSGIDTMIFLKHTLLLAPRVAAVLQRVAAFDAERNSSSSSSSNASENFADREKCALLAMIASNLTSTCFTELMVTKYI